MMVGGMAANATNVLFPVNQMFGGGVYTQPFTAVAIYDFLADSNTPSFYVGQSFTITPSGGTNPIVWLEPNTYQLNFPDSQYHLMINVTNSTNTLNMWGLVTTNPPPPSLYPVSPFPLLVAGANVTLVNNPSANTITISSSGGGGGVSSFTNLTDLPYTVTLTNLSGNLTFTYLSTNILGTRTNIIVAVDYNTNFGFIYKTNGLVYAHVTNNVVTWTTAP